MNHIIKRRHLRISTCKKRWNIYPAIGWCARLCRGSVAWRRWGRRRRRSSRADVEGSRPCGQWRPSRCGGWSDATRTLRPSRCKLTRVSSRRWPRSEDSSGRVVRKVTLTLQDSGTSGASSSENPFQIVHWLIFLIKPPNSSNHYLHRINRTPGFNPD